MARLKSRNSFPPGGFQWVEAQTGWQPQNWMSFEQVVQALIAHRKANAWIAKQNNLPTDYNSVANQVDEYNAARCLAHPGWEHFVGSAEPPKTWSPSAFQLRRRVESAAGAVRRTAAGVKLVAEWLGDGLRPVENALAEKRAGVCVTCPENGDPDWLQKVDAALAAEIKTMVEMRNDLKLSTIHDQNLHTCKVCDCYLRLKVHTPIDHIKNNMPKDVLAKLSQVRTSTKAVCWVMAELYPS